MKNDSKDVGWMEDFCFTIQNLVSAEHHSIESWCQTKDQTFLDLNKKLRRYRSDLLYKITPPNKAQTYCINKHLLASAQGLKELGNRATEDGDDLSAQELFNMSQDIEAVVILLNSDTEVQESFFNKIFKGGKNV